MNRQISMILVIAVFSTSCANYPLPIWSALDVTRASSSETMIAVWSLPLNDWPGLQKFTGLEHFRVAGEMAAQIKDAHIKAFSQLKLPELRQVSLAKCAGVTDKGIQALTNAPSIQGLQLIGVGITDRGMETLATEFPNLTGINVVGCRELTVAGFMKLTNSITIKSVGMSLSPYSQVQVEQIISTVSNVNWWIISDPDHLLEHKSLRQLGQSRQITIQVVDENNHVKGVTSAQSKSAPNDGPATSSGDSKKSGEDRHR